jgi:hypothetical protein
MLQDKGTVKINGPETEEISAEWRKLQNEDLLDFTLHQILFGRSNEGG